LQPADRGKVGLEVVGDSSLADAVLGVEVAVRGHASRRSRFVIMTETFTGLVSGADYPGTFQEFREWFPDEQSCLDYLVLLRWPDGFRCPGCGGDRFWRTAKAMFM